jgi:hypothetical protein
VDVLVQFFDTAVDVALLGVSNRSKLMLLLDHFGEVPEFGWSAHVFALEGVVDGLHVLQGLRGAFQFLVLSFLSRQHSLPDDGILNVLVHCLVYMF